MVRLRDTFPWALDSSRFAPSEPKTNLSGTTRGVESRCGFVLALEIVAALWFSALSLNFCI
jgi:hypothetical protein